MHAPTKDHWVAVKRILRYLQAKASYDLHVTRGSPLSLHVFTDADRASNVDDQKSTGGYLVYLGNTPVLSLGNLENNVLLLDPPQKPNTRP